MIFFIECVFFCLYGYFLFFFIEKICFQYFLYDGIIKLKIYVNEKKVSFFNNLDEDYSQVM